MEKLLEILGEIFVVILILLILFVSVLLEPYINGDKPYRTRFRDHNSDWYKKNFPDKKI